MGVLLFQRKIRALHASPQTFCFVSYEGNTPRVTYATSDFLTLGLISA